MPSLMNFNVSPSTFSHGETYEFKHSIDQIDDIISFYTIEQRVQAANIGKPDDTAD